MITSLYRDILSGYSTWEESPMGMITLAASKATKMLSCLIMPSVYVTLVILLPLKDGSSWTDCLNTWTLLLGLPGLIFAYPILKVIRYNKRWR